MINELMLNTGIPTRIKNYLKQNFSTGQTLLKWLQKYPSRLPDSFIDVYIELSRRIRNIEDLRGANRSLPHRWRLIYANIIRLCEGRFDFNQPYRFLNFGAGTKNPLALTLLFHLRGASESCSFEADQISESGTLFGLQEQIIDLLVRPEDYPGADLSSFVQKINGALEIKNLFKAKKLQEVLSKKMTLIQDFGENLKKHLKPKSMDFIYSRSVLEHLDDFNAVGENLCGLMSDRGVMVHEVDFTAHAIGDPFQFYYQETTQSKKKVESLNGLRLSDYIEFFSARGFYCEVLEKKVLSDYLLKRNELIPRYQSYPDEDLKTDSATLFIQKK